MAKYSIQSIFKRQVDDTMMNSTMQQPANSSTNEFGNISTTAAFDQFNLTSEATTLLLNTTESPSKTDACATSVVDGITEYRCNLEKAIGTNNNMILVITSGVLDKECRKACIKNNLAKSRYEATNRYNYTQNISELLRSAHSNYETQASYFLTNISRISKLSSFELNDSNIPTFDYLFMSSGLKCNSEMMNQLKSKGHKLEIEPLKYQIWHNKHVNFKKYCKPMESYYWLNKDINQESNSTSRLEKIELSKYLPSCQCSQTQASTEEAEPIDGMQIATFVFIGIGAVFLLLGLSICIMGKVIIHRNQAIPAQRRAPQLPMTPVSTMPMPEGQAVANEVQSFVYGQMTKY